MPNDPDKLTADDLRGIHAAVMGRGEHPAITTAEPKPASECIDEALRRLGEHVQAVTTAEGPERGVALRALLADDWMMGWLADAGRRDGEVEAGLVDLEAMRGGVKLADKVRRLIRRRRTDAPPVRLAVEGEALPPVEVDGQDITLPPGYHLAPDGALMRRGGEDRPDVVVAHRMMAATRRWYDEEQAGEVLDLAWRDGATWRRETVRRAVAMDARSIVALADAGCPVSSVSAAEVVRYLRAQVEGLEEEPGVAVSRCGWVADDYVLGHRTLMGGTEVRVVADEGSRQIADALACSGTWEGWLDTLRPAGDRPLVMLAIHGAVAAALLHPLRITGGAVMHWAAQSSRGKTTALRVAASVWGDPMAVGFVGSWDATAKKMEEQAKFCSDLPTLLDETSHVASGAREWASRMVYALASGRGRGRGTRGGSDATASYRTIAMSTGESPITSWCSQEGIAARTIELEGAPCQSGEQSRALVWGVTDHHGHLGPRAVDWIALQDADELRQRYRAGVVHWASRAEVGTIAARLGEVVALLEVASWVCQALGVPGDHQAAIEHAWSRCEEQARAADEGARAVDVLFSQVAAHADMVEGLGRQEGQRVVARKLPEGVAIPASTARDWLTRAGMDPGSVVAAWKARGWFDSRVLRLAGYPNRCWVLRDDWGA